MPSRPSRNPSGELSSPAGAGSKMLLSRRSVKPARGAQSPTNGGVPSPFQPLSVGCHICDVVATKLCEPVGLSPTRNGLSPSEIAPSGAVHAVGESPPHPRTFASRSNRFLGAPLQYATVCQQIGRAHV